MNTFIKNNTLLIGRQTEFIYDPNKLVLVYDTTTGNGNNTIYFPVNGTSPNIVVDWGDGSSDTYTTTGYKSHTYSTPGTYVVQVFGTMRTLSHSATIPVAGSKEKLIRCLSFGTIGLTSLGGGFLGCSNLIEVPANLPITSTITSLVSAFELCSNFNQSIDTWNVSNVTSMSRMFFTAINFNQSLPSWNVGRVTNFSSMFANASAFNGDLSGWNIGANIVTPSINMAFMFDNALTFNNSSISNWTMNKTTNIQGMFSSASFNQNINNWDVSNITNMIAVFSGNSSFNQPLNNWNTSAVTNMNSLFYSASIFNQNINNWNVSNVTDMGSIFRLASNYNQSMNSWDTSKVTNMGAAFLGAINFNGNISAWNTSNVTNMSLMFYYNYNFNQNISSWNTSKVTTMSQMFSNCIDFNQNIGSWDVSKVTVMDFMLDNADSFSSNLGNWNLSSLNSSGSMFGFMRFATGLNVSDYDNTLIGWNNNKASFRNDINISFGGSKYSSAAASARAALIAYGWTIIDGGLDVTYTPTPTPSVTSTNAPITTVTPTPSSSAP